MTDETIKERERIAKIIFDVCFPDKVITNIEMLKNASRCIIAARKIMGDKAAVYEAGGELPVRGGI